jgi:uncharacterized damage-inducible protein DinB
MTHHDLETLITYNYWARDRVLGTVAVLTPAQYVQTIESSFRSVRDTLVHTYSAEWVWYSRWQGTSPTAPLPFSDYPDVPSLIEAWRALELKIRAYVDGLDDTSIQEVLPYKLMNGQPGQTPIWQMVQHVVNHGAYHRGQVATLLRQLGATPISTDLIAFYRERTIGG